MLQRTLCHFSGIGLKTERRLWEAGLQSWSGWDDGTAWRLSASRREALRRELDESRRRLERGDALYFEERLPRGETWRLFGEFRRSAAFLDIETTGLSVESAVITTIALYDGRESRVYVRGRNLEDFREDIAGYRLIVTFNGRGFDVPFIRRHLGLPMSHAHVDLRHVLASLDARGGLKACEKKFGIERGEALEGVDGYFAVLLWRDYERRGNARALETLLAYNLMDVVNLESLMVCAYNLKLRDMPFGENEQLCLPPPPAIPFEPDLGTIGRLRARLAAAAGGAREADG